MIKIKNYEIIFIFFSLSVLFGCDSPFLKTINEKPNDPVLIIDNINRENVGADWVILKWQPVKNASEYRIYVKEGSNNWDLITDNHIYEKEYIENDTSLYEIKIKNLEPDNDYSFYITAVNDTGRESVNKNEFTIKTKLQTPIIIKEETINHHTVKLEWNNVSGAAYYAIFYSDNLNTTRKELKWDIEETSYVINTLIENTYFYFWVQAYSGSWNNKKNNSDFGTVSESETYLFQPVLFVEESLTTADSISLYWEAVHGADSYEIRYCKYLESLTLDMEYWQKYETIESKYKVNGLEHNTLYVFAIRAHNTRANKSIFSTHTVFHTRVKPPSDIWANEITKNSIKLEWAEMNTSRYMIRYRMSDQSGYYLPIYIDGDKNFADIGNLRENTHYLFFLSARDNYDPSVYSDEIEFSYYTLLSKPENLDAKTISEDSINLSWDQKEGASGYIVEVFDNTGINIQLTSLNNIIRSTFYTVAGLDPNTQYFFEVSAVNEEAISINAPDHIKGDPSYRITKHTLLSKPQPTISPANGMEIEIAWQQVIGADSYTIYYNTVNYFETAEVYSSGQTSLNCIIPDLEPYTVYYFWVQAFNNGNDSLPSESVIGIPRLPTPEPKITSYTSGSVSLSWDPVDGAEYYKVYYSTINSFDKNNPFSQINTTVETVTGLNAGTLYYFWVTAHNSINDSLESPAAEVITLFLSPLPEDPYRLSDRISLSWQQVIGADSYTIYYSTINSFEAAIEYSSGQTSLNCIIPGLEPNTLYYFWVRAFANNGNYSLPREPVAWMTLLPNPEPKITSYTSDSISLSWEPVDGAEYYKVYYSTSNSFKTDNLFSQTNTTTVTVTGLNAGTLYYFWVTAHNSINESLESPVAEVITYLTSPLTIVTYRLSDRIGLSWQHVDDAEYYKVYYNTDDSFETAQISVETSTTGHTVTGLNTGTLYYFWVTAHNKNASSIHSLATEVSTVTSLIKFDFIDFTNPSSLVLIGEHEEKIGETIIIRRVNRTSYTVIVEIDGWDSNPQWYLNGVYQPQESDDSFTIDWQWPIGSYLLSVVVTKNEIPYSTSVRFRVE